MDVRKVSVIELFSKFHVTLKEAWLNEVLEYLHVERANADIPTLIQLVYEQWLFSELSNSTRPKIRLSPFEKKTFLDNDIVVQINWLVDIHTSMYSKLSEYHGHNLDSNFYHWKSNDGTEDLDPAQRMYLMEVTDGQRKLRAIEYEKIDKLCGNSPRGTKLLIYGGTICRRNVLLLSSNNVMVLGGESEMCHQNASALIIAQRLGIDEKKLNLIGCVRNEEHENSMETVKRIEMKEAEKIQTIMPSIHMHKNVAANSDGQQSANICIGKTVKRENAREKKYKRPVLSRTITSYFQPERKIPSSKVCSEISVKSQMPLIDKKIKEETESGHLSQDSFQKQQEKVEPPPILFSSADSKQQSQHPIATTITIPQQSNESSKNHILLAQQSDPSAAISRVLCMPKIKSESGMKSDLREKSIATMQYQSQNVEKFCATSQFRMQPESLSAKLSARNFEITQSLIVADNAPTPSARKINAQYDDIKLSDGEREPKSEPIEPLISVWSTDLQRNSTDKIGHEAIISSSNIQEYAIRSANKWRNTINENSKQFLTNEFHVPAPKVQMQTVNDDGNNLLIESSFFVHRSMTDRSQNSSIKQESLNIPRQDVEASNVAFKPIVARCRSGTLLPILGQNHYGQPVTSSQQNPVPSHVSQNFFTDSEPQHVPEKSICVNTSFKNRSSTLVLPDATLHIIPHVNIIERYRALNIVWIKEACYQRRYCLVAHRKRVQPIFCKLRSGLQFIGQKWTAVLRIVDETCDGLDCLVHHDAVSNLIGFTPQEAQQAAASNDRIHTAYYKGRAQAMLEIFKRLDLILTVEFSSSSNVLPVIVDITNLSTALGLC